MQTVRTVAAIAVFSIFLIPFPRQTLAQQSPAEQPSVHQPPPAQQPDVTDAKSAAPTSKDDFTCSRRLYRFRCRTIDRCDSNQMSHSYRCRARHRRPMGARSGQPPR